MQIDNVRIQLGTTIQYQLLLSCRVICYPGLKVVTLLWISEVITWYFNTYYKRFEYFKDVSFSFYVCVHLHAYTQVHHILAWCLHRPQKGRMLYKWLWTILLVLDAKSGFFASALSILNFTPAFKAFNVTCCSLPVTTMSFLNSAYTCYL